MGVCSLSARLAVAQYPRAQLPSSPSRSTECLQATICLPSCLSSNSDLKLTKDVCSNCEQKYLQSPSSTLVANLATMAPERQSSPARHVQSAEYPQQPALGHYQAIPVQAGPTVVPEAYTYTASAAQYSYPPQPAMPAEMTNASGNVIGAQISAAPVKSPMYAAAGYPIYQLSQPPAMYAHPAAMGVSMPATIPTEGNEPCECSAGWVLFGVGWVFPICWLVGVFLPLCSKNRNDRRAAIGSGVMLAATVVAIILAVVIPLTILAHAASTMNAQMGSSYPAQQYSLGLAVASSPPY